MGVDQERMNLGSNSIDCRLNSTVKKFHDQHQKDRGYQNSTLEATLSCPEGYWNENDGQHALQTKSNRGFPRRN